MGQQSDASHTWYVSSLSKGYATNCWRGSSRVVVCVSMAERKVVSKLACFVTGVSRRIGDVY